MSSQRYFEWHPLQRKAQLEIEIVRLISSGTSAIVTAWSTYLSGRSVICGIAKRIAVLTEALPVQGFDISARQPSPAYVARRCGMNVCTEAIRARVIFLIGRRIQPVALDEALGLIKNALALQADQHLSSSNPRV